jgi:TolA-binding protein
LARYSLAHMHQEQGNFERAQEILERIPPPDYTGELVLAPYLLADCLIRQAPAKADDALAAGKLQEQLNGAVQLLTDFANNQPENPLVPDALLRLGLCQQRLAAILTAGDERNQMLKAAQTSYEKVLIDYPLNGVRAQAAFERGRCLALAGNPNDAIDRLRRFTHEPLFKDPIAPLALLQLATLLRGQENKAIEAAKVLALGRQRLEKNLLKDRTRAAWVPLLRFHHGAALFEAGQFAQARGAFEAVIRYYPTLPEATEAVLHWGQCLRDGGLQAIDQANQVLSNPDVKPAVAEAAKKNLDEGRKEVRAAVEYFEKQAEKLAQMQPESGIRARLLYQAIWANRVFADMEVEAVRNKIQDELRAKLREEAAKKTPEGQPAPDVEPPEIPLTKIPLQPGEKKVHALYQKLIEAFPDLALTNQARLEFAELLADRGNPTAAVNVLKEALDKEPPAELADRIRLRLGACYWTRGDAKAALGQFEVLAGNPQSPFLAQAHARVAECLLNKEDWEGAVKQLIVFRDQEPCQNIPNLSDWALLRLGNALGALKNADGSRQALEALITRFPESPFRAEAHYAAGWTWQMEKDYEKGLVAFGLAAANLKGERAARAQLQMGICQVALKQYGEALEWLQLVPGKVDNPELGGLALLEAAHAARLGDQPDQAKKCLEQLVRDYPKCSWAEIARNRLDNLDAAWTPPHDTPASARLLAPRDKEPLPPLERLGEAILDRVSLDDTTVEPGHAATLSHRPPPRHAPAAWIAMALPDPFENHNAVSLPEQLPDNLLPPREDVPLPPLLKK